VDVRAPLAALLLSALPCCGDREGGGEVPKGVAEGRFHALVERHRQAPVEERVSVDLPLAGTLSAAAKWGPDEPHRSELVAELLLARDLAVLDAMERGIEDEARRQVLFESVARGDGDPDVRELLGKWAQRDPDEIRLAIYRPGGVEFLFGVLEDATAAPVRRARCAAELCRTRDRSLVARLRGLENDPTPVPMRSLRAGGGVPTLGEIVRRSLEALER